MGVDEHRFPPSSTAWRPPSPRLPSRPSWARRGSAGRAGCRLRATTRRRGRGVRDRDRDQLRRVERTPPPMATTAAREWLARQQRPDHLRCRLRRDRLSVQDMVPGSLQRRQRGAVQPQVEHSAVPHQQTVRPRAAPPGRAARRRSRLRPRRRQAAGRGRRTAGSGSSTACTSAGPFVVATRSDGVSRSMESALEYVVNPMKT